MSPSRKARTEDDDERPGLMNRLVAAVLAPIFFNISVLVTIAVFWRKHPIRTAWLHPTSAWFRWALLLSGIAAVAGFVGGGKGLATFLGHCFYTNTPSEQNPVVTTLIWTAIGTLAWCIATGSG